MNFHEYSKQIVEDYLGTVAYVDDLIFSSKVGSQPIELITTTSEIREVAAKEGEVAKVEKEKIRQTSPNIDPLTFTNAFLEKGIHCALIEVTNEDDSLEPIKKTLRKSDVVILDWQMHGDLGDRAMKLLLSVLGNGKGLGLRLIIIYTENDDYSSIIEKTIIPKLVEAGINDGVLDKTGCEYLKGYTKIKVFKKENGSKTETSVSDIELPEKIIEELTVITEGLVSNTALKAISVIRRNSHNLLGVFNKGLDSGYLAHRAFLENPIDSEQHIIDWFADEIRDLLFVNSVSSEVNFEKISLVLDSWKIKDYQIYDAKGQPQSKITNELMLKLLELGCKKYNSLDEAKQSNISQKWYNLFYKTFGENSEFVNEKLAILSSLSLSSFNNELEQVLTLGTIVKKDEDFLLCIQPRCDSVRLKESTIFIFLKLIPSERPFNFLVPFNKEFCKLRISYKPDNFVIPLFIPINGMITTVINGGKKFFEDANKNKYFWVANLKHQFSQRISNTFASEISRVGLNESEWLRRSSDDV